MRFSTKPNRVQKPVQAAVCMVYGLWGILHAFNVVPMSRVEETIGDPVYVWYVLAGVGGVIGWVGTIFLRQFVEYIGVGWLGIALTTYGIFKLLAAPITPETLLSAAFSFVIGLGLLGGANRIKAKLWT